MDAEMKRLWRATLRVVAGSLGMALPNGVTKSAPPKLVWVRKSARYLGYYSPLGHSIHLTPSADSEVLVHEMVHAAEYKLTGMLHGYTGKVAKKRPHSQRRAEKRAFFFESSKELVNLGEDTLIIDALAHLFKAFGED